MVSEALAAKGHVAAIDGQFRAGDEARIVAAQEQDGAGDLAGFAQSPKSGPSRSSFAPAIGSTETICPSSLQRPPRTDQPSNFGDGGGSSKLSPESFCA